MTVGSTTASCGCGCSSDAPKSREQEIAELSALRTTIDERLKELAS
jgi:hypothetical protein